MMESELDYFIAGLEETAQRKLYELEEFVKLGSLDGSCQLALLLPPAVAGEYAEALEIPDSIILRERIHVDIELGGEMSSDDGEEAPIVPPKLHSMMFSFSSGDMKHALHWWPGYNGDKIYAQLECRDHQSGFLIASSQESKPFSREVYQAFNRMTAAGVPRISIPLSRLN